MKFKTILLSVAVLLISLGIGLVFAAWQEPTVSPPGGNVEAPINTGATPQGKDADIWATGFRNSDGNYGIWPANSSVTSTIAGDLKVLGYFRGDGSLISGVLTASTDYGRSGVSTNLYEGTTALSSKYLLLTGGTLSGDLTVGGGDLTISKDGYESDIIFLAQTNDPGYIKHYENNNVGIMYFSASDDKTTTDYFSFGSTPGGTYDEGARLTTSGNLQLDGNLTLGGTVDGYDISAYGPYFINSAGTSGQVWKSDGSGRGVWGTDNTGISTSEDYGRSGVSTNLYEGTTALSSKYAGISHAHSGADITSGTVSAARVQYGTYFITTAGTSGQVWKSDGSGAGVWGTDNTGITTSQDYGRSGVSATLYEGTTALSSKYAALSHAHSAADITSGTLAIARGGTNATTYTASQLIRLNSAGTAFESSGKTINDFLTTASDYGRSGVSGTLYEGTTALSSKYAGISHAHSGADITSGTVSAARVQYGTYFITSAGTSGQVWKSDGLGEGVWSTSSIYCEDMANSQACSAGLCSTSVTCGEGYEVLGGGIYVDYGGNCYIKYSYALGKSWSVAANCPGAYTLTAHAHCCKLKFD